MRRSDRLIYNEQEKSIEEASRICTTCSWQAWKLQQELYEKAYAKKSEREADIGEWCLTSNRFSAGSSEVSRFTLCYGFCERLFSKSQRQKLCFLRHSKQ